MPQELIHHKRRLTYTNTPKEEELGMVLCAAASTFRENSLTI